MSNLIWKLCFIFFQQEALGRRYAEELNERVLWWSVMQTFVIISIGISQVLILMNFFDKPTASISSLYARKPRYGI